MFRILQDNNSRETVHQIWKQSKLDEGFGLSVR